MFKPLISRYRLHAHSLNIETGRYYNIDRHARICNMCYKYKLQTIHDTLYTLHNYIIIIIAEHDIYLGMLNFKYK
jgi:hypothetical protein